MRNTSIENIVLCNSCGLLRRWNKTCQKCGRTTKYHNKYAYMLYRHIASGGSFSSFSRLISVKRDTLYAWEYKWPDFREARKFGQIKFLINKLEYYLDKDASLKDLAKAISLMAKIKALKY